MKMRVEVTLRGVRKRRNRTRRAHVVEAFIVEAGVFAFLLVMAEAWTAVSSNSLLHLSVHTRRRFSPVSFPDSFSRHLSIIQLSSHREDDTEDVDDEELIRLIRGPLGAQQPPRFRPKVFFILSDSTGATAKAAVERSLAQFNGCDNRYSIIRDGVVDDHDDDDDDIDDECINILTKVYPNVRSEQEMARILRLAQEQSGFVVFTLADPVLRETAGRMCELSRLSYTDLLGPMLQALSGYLHRTPLGTPSLSRSPLPAGLRRTLSDDYYRRIEAIEYTLKCDDGMSPHLMDQADVVLLGVSRTGKTPLSVYLSQQFALKVANVPLVVDLPPPRQLMGDPERRRGRRRQQEQKISPRKVFLLTLDPADLLEIRRSRLDRGLGRRRRSQVAAPRSTYADRDYLKRDLENAQRIALENDFTEIDVTGRAVEETASLIASKLNERFPNLGIGSL